MKTYKQNGWEVPEGYALIPVAPTENMVAEIQDAAEVSYCECQLENPYQLYIAAMQAAPQPPAKTEVSAEPVAWPRNSAQIRDFVGVHFNSMRYGQEDGKPCDNDRYDMTAHDLLSAIEWWKDCNSPQADAQAIRDATLIEAQQAAQIAVDTLRNNGKETEAFFAECCVDAIKRIMR